VGQKTHPKGFRLGITENWDSRWFAKQDYARILHQDLRIREFIREQALYATRQEVPHAVAVQLDSVTTKEPPPDRPKAKGLVVIQATILVERPGQKAILIGRQGRTLKQIGTAARLDLERWLGRKVFLELWVKVAKEWRANPRLLRELGYGSG